MKAPFSPVVLAVTLFSQIAHATIVTTLSDEDNGSMGGGSGISLREAVKYSIAGDTITFAPALAGKTIRLTLGHIPVAHSLTIDASALPGPITLSADRTGNGKTPDDTYVIHLSAGDLVLNSLILADANVGESKGCVTIAGPGSLSLKLDRCTLTRNSGYHSGAIYMKAGNLTISNSTFSGNSAVKAGSAFSASGSFVTIENSTFSQSAGPTMACWEGDLSIRHTTIAGNLASKGGPAVYYNANGTFSLTNSIVTGNTSASQPNVICTQGTFIATDNITSGDPRLAPLGDYGGPTQTMPPLPGSLALGSATWPPALAADQRGFPRTDKPEIGAVEFQGNADIARFWSLDVDGDGSPYGLEQALGTDPYMVDSRNLRNLAAPTFNAVGHPVIRFGCSSSAVSGTRWILKRSPDLSPGSFVEIYRYNRPSESAASGVTFVRTSSSVTVTDGNPFPGGGFYRFEALLEP